MEIQSKIIYINNVNLQDLLSGNFIFPDPPNGKYVNTFISNEQEELINTMYSNVYGDIDEAILVITQRLEGLELKRTTTTKVIYNGVKQLQQQQQQQLNS